jgi:4-hydroxy-tetrahydrodipicolinate synthase
MSFETLRTALADVVAIPVTPYRDGSIDLLCFKSLLRRLVDHRVFTITPNGNTSEFYALTSEERKELIHASVTEVGREAHLLLGVGHDTATAIADVQLGRSAGINMVMIHQPVHPHISPLGWVDYHSRIASAVPEMAFVLYVRTSWVTADMINSLADRCPNVIGIKYAVPDPTQFSRIRDAVGHQRVVWVAGLAEPYALSYAAHGATGFTSGLVNVNPQLSIALRDALRSENYTTARTLLSSITRFEEMRAEDSSANNVSVVKEALAQLGLCSREIRSPSHELNQEKRAEVGEIIRQWQELEDLSARLGSPSIDVGSMA